MVSNYQKKDGGTKGNGTLLLMVCLIDILSPDDIIFEVNEPNLALNEKGNLHEGHAHNGSIHLNL